MKSKLFSLICFLLLFYFSFAYTATYKGKNVLSSEWYGETIDYVEGEICILLYPETDPEDVYDLLSEVDANIIEDFSGDEGEVIFGLVGIPLESDLFEAIVFLNESPLIKTAEPNSIMYGGQVHPDDPYYQGTSPATYPHQWGLYNVGQDPPNGTVGADIDAPKVWDYETGNSDVVLVILDTGIPMQSGSLSHPDLDDVNKFILGPDLINGGYEPADDHGHGTHVTGIAAAETYNSTGIAGVAWNIKVVVIKVGDNNIIPHASASDFRLAVRYAIKTYDADVINFSYGYIGWNDTRQDAVAAADRADIVQVYITHNYWSSSHVYYPARHAYVSEWDDSGPGFSSVISVGATSCQDIKSDFSNWNSSNVRVTVGAPGGYQGFPGLPPDDDDIYSTLPGYPVTSNPNPPHPQYGYGGGTSMAAPHVAGVAALIRSRFPNLSAAEVREVIEKSAEKIGGYNYNVDPNFPGFSYKLGAGRINAFYAVAPPAAPQNLSIYEPFMQHPVLSWDANIEPDLKEYKIFRIGTDYYGGGWHHIATTTNNSYTDPQVYCGGHDALISYKIKAVDYTDQNSPFSNLISIWVIYKPTAGGKKEIIPTEYALKQNFPNPFNPATTISFDLPKESFVNLEIYDVSGRKVAALVNQQLSEGSYDIKFNASKIPSGIYIYKIQAGSFSETKRMLLIK